MSQVRVEATRWLKERVSPRNRRRLVQARLRGRSLSANLRTLPGCLIVGAQRCGTSSLYKYLGAHPQVVPSLRKETEYFSTRYTEGEAWYRSHFPLEARMALASRLCFEATPDYLLDPRAAARAAELVPDARIIALVRNPTERAYSQYQHNRRLGHEPLGFEEAIECESERIEGEFERLLGDPYYRALPLRRHGYVQRGRYAEQLRQWQRHFPADRIHVARFEDLIASPSETLTGIEQFLGIDEWGPASFANHSYGMAGKEATERMSEASRKTLTELFAPTIADLEELLGRPTGWLAPDVERRGE